MPAWHPETGGVRLRVHLQPGAKHAGTDGVVTDADGSPAFKVRVTAPPADGKANQALVQYLSQQLKVAQSAVTIVAGRTGRIKTLHLAGDADALTAGLEAIGARADDPR